MDIRESADKGIPIALGDGKVVEVFTGLAQAVTEAVMEG